MEIEQQDDVVDDSIRGELEKAFADSAPDDKASVVDTKESRARDETGKFSKSDKLADVDSEAKTVVADKIPDAPRSWTAAEKEKWNDATPEVRQAILRREQEVEQGFTKLDEDRNFGKSLKEVITPYLPIITAEGGTPVTAVKELLNTAYILRTAPVAQKTALFHQLAQQYGVDLSQPNNASNVQPNDLLRQTQQQLADLQQQIQQQPEVFRQQQESLAVKSQIDTFAADPKNAHYEKLKPVMASLLQAGQAKDLQDAYDKASWADPDIRSAMQTDQHNAAEAQRIADIKAKADRARGKVVSIKGAPSMNPVANGSAKNSIREDLLEAFELHS